MAGANFGRFLAYWLYSYELLKVGKLMPRIVNKDFSAQKDPMQGLQTKKTKQTLTGFNVLMVSLLFAVIFVHLASESILGVMLTYIPQIAQVATLGYAFVHIRGCMVNLGEAQGAQIAANEKRMYLQLGLGALTVVSGIAANLMTNKAKVIELDNDSIGSQERYYNAWKTPVYMWCLHYLALMAFLSSVMYVLTKISSKVHG